MTHDPSLLDHLLTVMPEQDAFDVYLWAQHPWAVRLLLEDKETAFSYEMDGGMCRSCEERWGEYDAEHHLKDCRYVEALRVLKNPKLKFVELAAERWEKQLAEMARLEADVQLARRTREGAALVEGHFADETTAELQHEELFSDEHGVFRPPPHEDY